MSKTVIWQNGRYIEPELATINNLNINKQNKLTAGAGIVIKNDIISCNAEIFKIVDKLPSKPLDSEFNKIFIIPNKDGLEDNIYLEYVWVNNKWEKLGEFKVETKFDETALREEISKKLDKLVSGVNIATIDNKDITKGGNISIPKNISELTLDTTHRVVTDVEKQTWNAKQPAGDYATNTAIKSIENKNEEQDNKISTLNTEKANTSDIPKNTSQLKNDSGFLTKHLDITGKLDKKIYDTEKVHFAKDTDIININKNIGIIDSELTKILEG